LYRGNQPSLAGEIIGGITMKKWMFIISVCWIAVSCGKSLSGTYVCNKGFDASLEFRSGNHVVETAGPGIMPQGTTTDTYKIDGGYLYINGNDDSWQIKDNNTLIQDGGVVCKKK
jgi:hypothetical protein